MFKINKLVLRFTNVIRLLNFNLNKYIIFNLLKNGENTAIRLKRRRRSTGHSTI